MSDDQLDSFKEQLNKPPRKDKPATSGLSTGSTLLNLAMTGNPSFGVLPGKYYLYIGDSESGKTWLSLSCMAEATINKKFDSYRLIYDNVEDGALMDLRHYFGKLADRIEPPAMNGKKKVNSSTIEEFYYHVDDACDGDKPFIYVLDSMDALSSDDEEKKFQEQKKAHRAGKEIAGSYGDGKAKKNSSGLRRLTNRIKDNNSIVIVIAQTRDNIGFGAQYNPKTRSGGKALKFYSATELWFSIKESITKTVRGKTIQSGNVLNVKVKKNRNNGRKPEVDLSFYPTVGIDDVGSCIDFLVDWKHWSETKGVVDAKEFKLNLRSPALVSHIEKHSMEIELRDIVASTWDDIEESLSVKRKNRYE